VRQVDDLSAQLSISLLFHYLSPSLSCILNNSTKSTTACRSGSARQLENVSGRRLQVLGELLAVRYPTRLLLYIDDFHSIAVGVYSQRALSISLTAQLQYTHGAGNESRDLHELELAQMWIMKGQGVLETIECGVIYRSQ